MQGNLYICKKNLAFMIRYKSNNQQKIEMFITPFEMNLNPNNRWVKLSKSIPWDELASIYYQAMNSRKGAPSIDAWIVISRPLLTLYTINC